MEKGHIYAITNVCVEQDIYHELYGVFDYGFFIWEKSESYLYDLSESIIEMIQTMK